MPWFEISSPVPFILIVEMDLTSVLPEPSKVSNARFTEHVSITQVRCIIIVS